LLSIPASAATVTDNFTGVVAATDAFGFATTLDNSPTDCAGGHCFGGGNLVGDPFTLTVTMTVPTGATSGQITGGTFYSGPDPVTMTLTINGNSLNLGFLPSLLNTPSGSTSTVGNSGALVYGANGSNKELGAQAFIWSSGGGGEQLASINLDVVGPGASGFGQLGSSSGTNPCGLPTPNGCLDGLATEFATFDGDLIALDITGVNPVAATPLPSTFGLFGSVLTGGLLMAAWRRRRHGFSPLA
jgi:hypothetical protein